jgi:hypothetical protein
MPPSPKIPVGLRFKAEALRVMDAAAVTRSDYRPGHAGQYNVTALTGVPRSTASAIRKTIGEVERGQQPDRDVRLKVATKIAGLHAFRTGMDLFDAMRELFEPVDEDGHVVDYRPEPRTERALAA